MKHLFILAIVVLKSIAGQAQVTESREAKEAVKLEVKNGIEVIITQNDTVSLKVGASDWGTTRKVVTKYKGNTLKVYLENPDGITPTGNIRVYVSQKSFPEIKAEGGAAVKADRKWIIEEANISLATGATFSGDLKIRGACKINASSGAGFRGVIHAGTIKANVTGGAFVKITGTAAFANVFCNSGTLQGGKLICNKTEITAQNASAVSIQALEKIKADTDASSAITYYGSPEKTEVGENAYTIKRQTGKLSLN